MRPRSRLDANDCERRLSAPMSGNRPEVPAHKFGVRAMAKLEEGRLEDQCWCRSHTDETTRGGSWLRSAEGKQLQLLEAVLDRGPQLICERLQALLRAAIVAAQSAATTEDRRHRVQPGPRRAGAS